MAKAARRIPFIAADARKKWEKGEKSEKKEKCESLISNQRVCRVGGGNLTDGVELKALVK